jgi:hypothetical protein
LAILYGNCKGFKKKIGGNILHMIFYNILHMIMNCGLTWEDQISNVIRKVYFSLSRLLCTASFTPIETRRRLVVVLILPIFLYCDVIFSQSSVGNRRILNLAYNSCVRYVYKVSRSEHISDHARSIMGVTYSSISPV